MYEKKCELPSICAHMQWERERRGKHLVASNYATCAQNRRKYYVYSIHMTIDHSNSRMYAVPVKNGQSHPHDRMFCPVLAIYGHNAHFTTQLSFVSNFIIAATNSK